MHPVVNHLIQLQELILIHDEQQKVAAARLNGTHLDQLDQSIRMMTDELPGDTKNQFIKLCKRDHLVIVPVTDNVCAGCGMSLAISQVQAVRLAREIISCPNCARMLYVPASAARRVTRREPRFGGPRKVGISRFSAPELMVPALQAEDMEGAIRELAGVIAAAGFVDRAEPLIEAALRREAILSTVTNHGIAFPHVRHVEGGGLTLACGLSAKGFRTEDESKTLTRIVFFIVIPTAASAFYLKLLSGLAEAFSDAEARKALSAEKESEKMWKTLIRLTRTTVK